MARISRERAEQAAALVKDIGPTLAAKGMGISRETVRRYARIWKKMNEHQDEGPIETNLIRQIRDRWSDDELRKMLNGSAIEPNHATMIHNFSGKEVVFGVITDTHLGSKYTNVGMLEDAFSEFKKAEVDFIAHCGDVFEGLSHRPGHCYECTHLGYSAQLEHGREVFGKWTDSPIYMIDGNHDRWFIKSNGAKIVEELCLGQKNLHFLGHDEGDIKIGGLTIKLWHGEDGNSYAFSYRIQKIVEAFTGGEKPDVLICGHTHKQISMFDRHIHCISAGSMQKQSKWMRSKRHASHTGFYIVRMTVNKKGVASFAPRFYPFYQ